MIRQKIRTNFLSRKPCAEFYFLGLGLSEINHNYLCLITDLTVLE